jgi:hypothetical protein
VCPLNPYVEAQTPVSQNVTMCGDKAFNEIIKLKHGHYGGVESKSDKITPE